MLAGRGASAPSCTRRSEAWKAAWLRRSSSAPSTRGSAALGAEGEWWAESAGDAKFETHGAACAMLLGECDPWFPPTPTRCAKMRWADPNDSEGDGWSRLSFLEYCGRGPADAPSTGLLDPVAAGVAAVPAVEAAAAAAAAGPILTKRWCVYSCARCRRCSLDER